jgi:hypothetical protein
MAAFLAFSPLSPYGPLRALEGLNGKRRDNCCIYASHEKCLYIA